MATPTTAASGEAHSTPPSSPPSAGVDEEQAKEQHALADEEDLGHEFRGLQNLLAKSKLFSSIMAEKLKRKEQQQQRQAKREEAKSRAADTKDGDVNTTQKNLRSKGVDNATTDTGNRAANGVADSKDMPVRGRPKKNAPKKRLITDFIKTTEVNMEDTGGVQDALLEAANEYEDKPEGLGAQQLMATEQPSLVTGGEMRHYQLEGLEWLKSLYVNGLSGILADEMGLGKTVQTISLIAFLKEKNIPGPFLIAAPLSTLRNWMDEFKKWTPKIKTILYHGSKPEREGMRRTSLKQASQKSFDFPVIITSYEICMNDKKFLGKFQWKYIIIDEGHRLKNMDCMLIKELMLYTAENRLLITGTPLQNNIAELWSLLHFLMPQVFSDLATFSSWFDFTSVLEGTSDQDSKAKKQKDTLVSSLHAILKPFLLRRVKTDVESNLPKKREYILYAPLSAEQKDLYREILSGTSRTYLESKAVERIEARSRTASLKRKANDSGSGTPAKSVKTSRASTPASTKSGRSSLRGRKVARTSYKDLTDSEFNAKLQRLERGQEDSSVYDASSPVELSSDEAQERAQAQTLKLAKKEMANKKLQNPIMQARLTCNSPHNFYWPWQPSSAEEEVEQTFPGVDESLVTASGKMLLLDTLLPRLLSRSHKVLIFSQFKRTLDIIETYCSTLRDWPCCRIDGSIAQDVRYEQITSFNDPKSDLKIFLLSTRAGGQGINLTAADTVILFDSDWNPQQDLQAMDRAHRIGQKRPVIVYRFATRGTVEENLLLKADGKRKLEKLVIKKGKFKSLLDTADDSKAQFGLEDTDNLKSVLLSEDFEKYDLAGYEKGQILSEEELKILTDRSDEAYERASKGLDMGGAGAAFVVAETKTDEVLGDLTTKGTSHKP